MIDFVACPFEVAEPVQHVGKIDADTCERDLVVGFEYDIACFHQRDEAFVEAPLQC